MPDENPAEPPRYLLDRAPVAHREKRKVPIPVTAACAILLAISHSLAGDPLAELEKVKNTDQDAAPILQKAVETMGVVPLPAGKFRLRSPVRLQSNQGLVGPATFLVDFDSKEPHGAFCGKGENLRFEGFAIRKTFKDGSYASGILIDGPSKNVVVRNLDISGYSARYGIHLVEVDGFEVSGCYIHDFMMDADADMILDSPAGLRVTRSDHGVIANNRILRIDVGPHGLVSISPLKPDYGPQHHQSDSMTLMQSRHVTVTGNVLDVSGEGIDLLLSSECVVTGNIIRNIWFQGIKLLGVSYSVITGNFISECYEGIGLQTHKQFHAECTGNTIVGNTILNTGSPATFGDVPAKRVHSHGLVAIDIGGTSRRNLVANNLIHDNQEKPTMEKAISPNSEFNLIRDNLTPESQ